MGGEGHTTRHRVVHVVEASFAGVGRHVIDLARHQAAAGFEVTVAYGTNRASSSFLADAEVSSGVRFEGLEVQRGLHPTDIVALLRLRRLIAGTGSGVVHGHATKGGFLARAVPGSGRRLRRVYTPHAVYSMNPELSPNARRLVVQIERAMALRTDLIVAVSPEERRHLRSIGVADRRLATIPNGSTPLSSPVTRAEARAELGLPRDSLVVGFVGRLDRQKAPEMLVRAFQQFARGRTDAHLAIVGEGPMRPALEAIIRDASATQTHLLGERPGQAAMRAFDVLVLPSRYEGFPYVLIEALQLGVPIITTTTASASLLFGHETTVGWQVAPEDPDALAAALEEWASSDREAISSAAASVGHQYTAATMAAQTITAMQDRFEGFE